LFLIYSFVIGVLVIGGACWDLYGTICFLGLLDKL